MVTKEQKQLISEMSEELREKYRLIRQQLVSADQNDLLMRHGIGMEVVEVLDNESTYGSKAIVQLSQALGGDMSEGELYHYAQLARAYSEEELTKLTLRRTAKGNAISWTKLREVLPLEPGQRRSLLKRLFEEDLTVRELAQAKKELLGGGARSGRGPSVPRTPLAACDQIHKLVGEMRKRAEYWEDALFAKIREQSLDELADQDVLRDRLLSVEQDSNWLLETAKDLQMQVGWALSRISGESDAAEPEAAAAAPAAPKQAAKKKAAKKSPARPAKPKATKAAKQPKGQSALPAPAKPPSVKGAAASNGKAGSIASRVKRARAAAAAR